MKAVPEVPKEHESLKKLIYGGVARDGLPGRYTFQGLCGGVVDHTVRALIDPLGRPSRGIRERINVVREPDAYPTSLGIHDERDRLTGRPGYASDDDGSQAQRIGTVDRVG
jgi:hypothetical protein